MSVDQLGGGLIVCRPEPLRLPARLALLSDLHIGARSTDHGLILAELDRAEQEGARILVNGDVFDCIVPSDRKRYQPSALADRLSGRDDVLNAAVDWAFELFRPVAHLIDVCGLGNHECHEEGTELLTDKGWVDFRDLTKAYRAATVSRTSGRVEYQPIEEIHSYDFNGLLWRHEGKSTGFSVTPNHRMLVRDPETNNEICEEAYSVLQKDPSWVLPLAARSKNEDFPVEDDWLRLLGWVLTDGHIGRGKKKVVVIYQRESKVRLILDILRRAGVPHNVQTRQRNLTHVCGRYLKKTPEPECAVHINQCRFLFWLLSLVGPEKELPHIVRWLSDRQFTVLLEAIVDGDGSRHKQHPETSWMVYGKEKFLSGLQAACVTHGWRATMSVYRECQYRLNVNRRSSVTLGAVRKRLKAEPYVGKVWCATVENGTLITRRDGKVLVSGNSAVMRHGSFDPVLALVDRLNDHLEASGDAHRVWYGGYCFFACYKVEGSRRPFTVFAHHGFGKGKGNADYERLYWVEGADLVWLGHLHDPVSSKKLKILPPASGYSPVSREVRFVRTGAYLRTYEGQTQKALKRRGGVMNYGSVAAHSPNGLGGARVTLLPAPRGYSLEVTQ